uniref:Beta-mannanase-like protein n=1 Tax=uncultured bacterium contig00025 TaxID=1181514 RepID=A0A806KMX5_9BACT|nr:beta-mannanase-like protein [uncultured bacterium contig00025]
MRFIKARIKMLSSQTECSSVCEDNDDARAAVNEACRGATGGGATGERKIFPLTGIIIILAIGLSFAGGALYYLKNSSQPLAVRFRGFAGDFINTLGFPACPDPEKGLNVIKKTLYVNNKISPGASFQRGMDNKLVMETPDGARLFDYATGYYVDLPDGTEFDFSKSPKFVRFYGEGFSGVISKEWSVGYDVSEYVGYYFNRFVLDEGYGTENQIRVISEEKSDAMEKITVYVENLKEKSNMYTYMIFKTNSRFFFRVMLKYDGEDTRMERIINNIADSFYFFKPKGKAVYDVDFFPVTPEYWSDETTAAYERLKNLEKPIWGIFTGDIFNKGINERIPGLEEKLGYKFEIIHAYAHLNGEFPLEFMRRCYDEGRMVQLTYQFTLSNNLRLYGASPTLRIYRGGEYEQIRDFARKAKEFGHPFLFRLNNEMNSDWTSYGGVVNLMDPDIYADVWRYVYKIFGEEGVDNAIWVFSPNDRDYPPNNWNSFVSYYPGNEYVHIIGLTGYNTGTYYEAVYAEKWREFETIYDGIAYEYNNVFDNFPWIISEIASSSIGGDKEKWITGMFDSLKKYPRIKAAVWFSSADYDPRPGYEGSVSRPYWLDETSGTVEAFKNGLRR